MTEARDCLAFVGTFTWDDSEGIYSYRLDGDTGGFTHLATTPAGENPAFLALAPDGDHLYAVNEVSEGTVTSFAIDRETGELEQLNRRSSEAAGPCHLSVDATGQYVLVAHYGGERVSMLPIEDDGTVGEASDVVRHEGSSVDPDRQTVPRPHSIVPGPENRFAYAPDLGADRVFIYELDLDAGKLRPAETQYVDLQDGAGPRHFDFHPSGDFGYLLNEMDSTLTAFERDAETGALSEIETVGTLPADFDGDNSTADVHVHPSGRWVYGSNRGHDSIVCFEIDEETGGVTSFGHEPTGGEEPRNFALDPSGTWLFAENQDTNDVISFAIDADTGELTSTGHTIEVPRPVCMKLLEG